MKFSLYNLNRPHIVSLSRYSFTLKFWPIVFFLLGLYLLMTLGFWQLRRADEKREILKNYQQRINAAPIDFDDLKKRFPIHELTAVRAKGSFDNKHQFLLDNKFYEHRVGFNVITPLQIATENKVLLVDRGWVPQGKMRQTLPTLPIIKNEQSLSGLIYFPSKKALRLGAQEEKSKSWPLIIQTIQIKHLEKLLKMKIFPFILRLEKNAPQGFSYNWKPVNMMPAKHIGYAVQWFALAILLVIVGVAVSIHRKEKSDE